MADEKRTNRGQHPNSRSNLKEGGRPPLYGVNKEGHEVSVTREAWEGLRAIAVELGCGRNVSELMEKIGRGEFGVIQSEPEITIASSDNRQ